MMDNKLIKSQMDHLVGNFKKSICKIFGISEEEFTLFIQANIEGHYYIGVNGNLNDLVLSSTAMPIGSPTSEAERYVEASIIPSPVSAENAEVLIENSEENQEDFSIFK